MFSAAPANSVSSNGVTSATWMVSRSIAARPGIDDRSRGTGVVPCRPASSVSLPSQYSDAGSSRVAVDQHDARERRMAQVRRPLGHRVEHRLHVGRRARDHAQDLADRRLLLERVGELARALVDLALETGVGLAQLRGHPVEAIGQRFQLVARPHDDLLVEVALADPLRAFRERADRPHHAARERQRAEPPRSRGRRAAAAPCAGSTR